MPDHRVGGVEDHLRGAVVLLERHHLGVGIVAAEAEDVAHISSPPPKDRLIIVSHDGEVAVLLREQLHQDVLGQVGVLVLVDEEVSEPRLVVLTNRVGLAEELHRSDEQVVEVERVGAAHLRLIGDECPGDGALVGVPGVFDGVRLRIEELVLGGADDMADLVEGKALVVDAGDEHRASQRGRSVSLVVDRVTARDADGASVAAQDPGAERVEGADPHARRAPAEERLDATAHLARGLVGERDRADLVRAHVASRQHVCDAVGEHPRLAAAGAGEDEQRPVGSDHRLTLGVVEVREDRRGGGGGAQGVVAVVTAPAGRGGGTTTAL